MGYFSVVYKIMAYSSVRVQFEIGHEASIRTKKTPEGFTHDWEVFVRGADSTDIQYFVEKIVFYLHETFPKPKRVIKDPPYLVKESGYAGFVLPIDVYLKNKEEPKKISFQYDLTLQPSGPPISKVLREPRLFQNPSEDFRRKLIRGGGVGVDTPSEAPTEDSKSTGPNQNKSKLVESSMKKHKPEPTSNHSFAELFGPPIRRVQEPKKVAEIPKKVSEVDSGNDKKKLNKHGPYRDDKEVTKEKEKSADKERLKERDKIKEKPLKRPSTPPPPFPLTVKTKDENKKLEEKEKKKEEHDDKKKKKDDKEKKEKNKDGKEMEKSIEKDQRKDKKMSKEDYARKMNSIKPQEAKLICEKHNSENVEKEKPEKEKHRHRHKKKEKEKNRDKERHRKDRDKGDKDSRERDKDKERERKSKKRQEEERQKEEKARKKSSSPSPPPPLPPSEKAKKGPLNALLDELGSSDSASPLSEEDSVPAFKAFSKPPAKIVPDVKPQSLPNVNSKTKSTNLSSPSEGRPDKEINKTPKPEETPPIKIKKDKPPSKKNKRSDKDVEKRKAKEEANVRPLFTDVEDDDPDKEKRDNKEEREKEVLEDKKPKTFRDKENRKRKKEKSAERHLKGKRSGAEEKSGSLGPSQSAGPEATREESSDGLDETRRPDKFTKEYVAQLKDLQHRIMTLEDNAELQKVVKVIAETGQYEITKKTFDFDLCALDFETIKRLQEFFGPT